jgi:GntR family transcriptional repressor for pyruvate dehydrogenase complex
MTSQARGHSQRVDGSGPKPGRAKLGDDDVSFRPIRPVRSYERIVEQIEEAIVEGRLRGGDFLPSEREMMAQFAVSRSTVREAMRVLESNGLIRSRPGNPNGAEVLGLSTVALRKTVDRLVMGRRIRLADLVHFRMLMESSASMLAARLRTEEDLVALESALEDMHAAVVAGYEAFSAADVRFHGLVAQASANALIQVCNDVVHDVVLDMVGSKIATPPESTSTMEASLQHHADALDAIRAGDAQRAGRMARENLFEHYSAVLPPEDCTAVKLLLDVCAAAGSSEV